MFDNIVHFFKKFKKSEKEDSKSTAKERLHLVLAQDRANISADFLEMMKQEIIEVIKKYIDIDEKAIDVRLTNKEGEDGSVGAPALYANIPIITIKNEARKLEGSIKKEENSFDNDENNVSQEGINKSSNSNNINNDNTETNDNSELIENVNNVIEDEQKQDSEDIVTIKSEGKHAMQEDVAEAEISIEESGTNNIDEVENEKKDS